MVDPLADRVLEHFKPVQSFLLEVLDADSGDVVGHTFLDEFFFRYGFQLLGLDLHQLACLLSIRGEAAVGVEDQRLVLPKIKTKGQDGSQPLRACSKREP